MRKLTIALALATMLTAAAAAASGALPRAGVRFTGLTSAKKVNGFQDTVTFVTGTRSLRRFSFGTLGCFGYGTFPVGVDPYATSLAQLKTVPLTPKGTFSVKSAAASYNAGDPGGKLLVTVTGRFSSARSATGTISVVETAGNGGSCGPVKMTFTAKQGSSAS
ncbi:MAG TPA: hypothetical protein VFB42_12180 [Gaiellaceae bacterium]|nr:hypothetical protein [Gaiellaceae bacterium]